MWRNYILCTRYVYQAPFLVLWNSNKYTPKNIFSWWCMFNAFLLMCEVSFFTTYGKNGTHIFDTKVFVSVASLCGVVGSPSWFTKCLIGKTGNIWWVVYINSKCMYSSKNSVCTIIEFAIVHNVNYVNSSWPFISWWSSATNVSGTIFTEIPYLKYLEVIFVP